MKLKKLNLYIDTSVIGGYFDVEFEKETKILFESVFNNEFHVIYSSITEDELIKAPEKGSAIIKFNSKRKQNKNRINGRGGAAP